MQRVLVLGVADPAADAKILHGLQEERGARHVAELAAQALDHTVDGQLALLDRLERDEHATGVRGVLVAAHEGDDVGDSRVGLHHVDEVRHLLAHGRRGDVLLGLDVADEPAGILLREEALGHDDEQVDVEGDRGQEHGERQRLVAQDPAERASVETDQCLEQPLAELVQPAVAHLAG